jgi:hypothetical protein
MFQTFAKHFRSTCLISSGGVALLGAAYRLDLRTKMGLSSAFALSLLAAGCSSPSDSASNPNSSSLRSAATAVGWATTAPEPKDFVLARRSKVELDYVPVGRQSPERPVVQRNAAAVRDLETQLDQTRDASERFARRQLPAGAYGQALPSVAAPPRPVAQSAPAPRSTSGSPDSYPVNPNRLRQIRENARQVAE